MHPRKLEEDMEGYCDCGGVVVVIPDVPDTINACPCAFCSRAGAHWGYYQVGTVEIRGETQTYRRASKVIEFHRCAVCGVLTHWQDPSGGIQHMGVHMKNFDAGATSQIPVVVDP